MSENVYRTRLTVDGKVVTLGPKPHVEGICSLFRPLAKLVTEGTTITHSIETGSARIASARSALDSLLPLAIDRMRAAGIDATTRTLSDRLHFVFPSTRNAVAFRNSLVWSARVLDCCERDSTVEEMEKACGFSL